MTAVETVREAAVGYAEAGRVVFPVRDKRPLVKWGKLQPGPQHVKQVAAWWASIRCRGADIAMRTGDGLAVVDFDPRHGGDAAGWPETLAAATPSGGVHLFYSSPKPVRNSAGQIGPGIDIRGEQGYVVVPPAAGREWIIDAAPAPLPPIVFRAQRQARDRSGGARSGGAPFELLEAVPEGQRNPYLARYAGWLHSAGWSELEVEQEVHWFNAEVCHPPLDEHEVDGVLASIARYHR